MSKLTREKLKEIVYYDPETGVFTRFFYQYRKQQHGGSTVKIYDEHKLLKIFNKLYRITDLIVLYMTGQLPKRNQKVCNVDGVYSNIAWNNLLVLPRYTSILTRSLLKEALNYDPDTGIFTWKLRLNKNTQIGDIAGSSTADGYLGMRVFGTGYLAHRLAFLYMTGKFPHKNLEIDHKDKIKHHNWWSNLRAKSHQCNIRNTGNLKNNTSGVKGVVFVFGADKWRASIKINKVQKYLGYYGDFDNAVCARLAAEQCVNWSGCDSDSPAFQYVQNMLKKVNLF